MLENDKDSQIKVVEDFTNRQVDGIVLAPLDNVALEKPVEDASKANIPVVIIDSGLNGTGYISMISTDNEKGGEIAGDELAKELNGKGKVVMLRYDLGSASTDAREKGFLESMAKNPGITVVSKDQYGGVTAESAQSKSENLLAPHKKGDGLDIDGIFTPNESTTFGMLRCLESANLAGKVKFVGFDASEKLLDGLTKGQVNALVIQNPRKMGYDGVKTIVDYLKGNKNVNKNEDTGATLLTLANMKDPDVAKLIAPPKE
jgi:ribose transport system substrate-binding protein